MNLKYTVRARIAHPTDVSKYIVYTNTLPPPASLDLTDALLLPVGAQVLSAATRRITTESPLYVMDAQALPSTTSLVLTDDTVFPMSTQNGCIADSTVVPTLPMLTT